MLALSNRQIGLFPPSGSNMPSSTNSITQSAGWPQIWHRSVKESVSTISPRGANVFEFAIV
jgi:hypothetical protein